ncbi:MAG TPA: bifunctional nuclease family protein [Blastocatellia bacterium]|nr:bifunctional nuclease family protein [Blastocatellia bacterium]
MDVEVKIRGLMMDPSNNSPIVVLKDANSDTMLPIWVGHFEAHAIAIEIEKHVPQRPMTHDLLKNLIDHVGGRVERIVVTELVDNTFYAVIELNINGEKSLLDSRPSDAIALALRTDAPIYVREEVLEHSARMIITSGPEGEEAEIERPAAEESETEPSENIEWPDELDDDFTKYKM